MKKILNFLVMGTSLIASVQAQETIQPKKVIFLWDLHHVVLKPHRAFRTAMKYPHKAKAFGHKKTRGKVLKLLLKGIFKESSSDKFVHLADKYENPHLKEFIILASNSQRLMHETVDIIKELAQNGYTHHIGSNIGQTAFLELSDPETSPEFCDLFKLFDLEQSHVVAHKDGLVVKKPDPEFFKQYLEKNNLDLESTQIIFIDDKKENVIAAREIGFTAIRFKNADQLRKDLAELGIKISQQAIAY